MSGELIVLVVVVVFVVALASLVLAYLTAHRLDRLHIRTDLARAALAGALERRHTVATAVIRDLRERDPVGADRLARALARARAHPPGAITGPDPAPHPEHRRHRDADDHSDDSTGPDAEIAENTLGVVLSGVDTSGLPADLAAELEDATDRVSMARRFYNDAVRDTRTLREQTPVRVLRLAGRAPMPGYVELVDAPPPQA
ncbi:LemA family protein [Dietzia sp. B32]|uniref:LemA family protein n=1 Tax=Dietzia sp. B32 TaxID=2915130 RepID=UPI0021AD8EF0|nr:LemA family protein [Dietzia sp. B32]UVE95552.1 LemA family protein [Dietzia sp. B32]